MITLKCAKLVDTDIIFTFVQATTCNVPGKIASTAIKKPCLEVFLQIYRSWALSLDEINTINASRVLICEFLKSLSDNIARTEDAWRHYGVRSDNGKAFDFYPSLFIDRQRQYLKLLENRL